MLQEAAHWRDEDITAMLQIAARLQDEDKVTSESDKKTIFKQLLINPIRFARDRRRFMTWSTSDYTLRILSFGYEDSQGLR